MLLQATLIFFLSKIRKTHAQRYIYKHSAFNNVAYEEGKYNPGKDMLWSKIRTGKEVPREKRLKLKDKAYIIISQSI